MKNRLTLYTRSGCHLCDDLLNDLQALDEFKAMEVDQVNIDASAKLQAQYGQDVPVLALGDTVICKHFLNPQALREGLARVC